MNCWQIQNGFWELIFLQFSTVMHFWGGTTVLREESQSNLRCSWHLPTSVLEGMLSVICKKGEGAGDNITIWKIWFFSTHFFNHSLYLTENTKQTQNQVCGVTRKQASTKLTWDSHNVIFSSLAYNKGYLILNTTSCRIST